MFSLCSKKEAIALWGMREFWEFCHLLCWDLLDLEYSVYM